MGIKNLLITGNSSGLGYGLTEEYLSRGYAVYGLSRRGCQGLDGKLADVAPTILHCLNIKPPAEMTGQSMFISGEVPIYRN